MYRQNLVFWGCGVTFYESKSNLAADEIKIERSIEGMENFSFPAHLHGSFELITVTDGKLIVTVDKNEYLLERGKMILIFPNQVHELKSVGESSHYLCIFSPKLVAAYSKLTHASIPQSNLFSPSTHLIEDFLSLHQDNSLIKSKGLLYSICAEFDRDAAYRNRETSSGELLPTIFKFVENNFSTRCSLSDLAKSTSYSYEYLSKYFRRHTGITFTDYVCGYRINEARYVLQNSELSILQVSLECGFDSLRSFNRNFKKVLGITPSEYRAKSI